MKLGEKLKKRSKLEMKRKKLLKNEGKMMKVLIMKKDRKEKKKFKMKKRK
jgi:hypothetical protein